ncbi:uncharacterized protein LOC119188215 [Rhipicephalus microplus]|uniref:uncharacterized protein LOC119188215 n=1 Tax=Rhipicephalus microplus TaxID=6941 RepID=UPI003F6CF10D
MQGAGRKKLVEVNPNLTCVLCNGYFIDATTIIECLHSFCKTCIVKYLEKSKLCPVCDVQVHKTRPLLNIRADQTLQDIVYKVVPGLFRNEMARRRQFYNSLSPSESSAKPTSSEERGDVRNVERLIFNRDDMISLSLEYSAREVLPIRPLLLGPPPPESQECPAGSRRYLLCPGGFTVGHLKKFLRAKFGLSKNHEVDVMYMHDHLLDEYSLMDLAYIFSWRRNAPMRLLYRFPVLPPSLMSTSSKADDVVPVPPDEGLSIYIQSTASQQNTSAPLNGTAASDKKGQTPSSDASANANAVCATINPDHLNTASTNGSDKGSVGANLSSTIMHANSVPSENETSLSNKDGSTEHTAANFIKPTELARAKAESSPVKQPIETSPTKLPQNARSKQGSDNQLNSVISVPPAGSLQPPPQRQQPLQSQTPPRSQQSPRSQQPPQIQLPALSHQPPQRSPQKQLPPQCQQLPQTQQQSQSQPRKSPQIVKLSPSVKCTPCLPTAPRVTGVKPGVDQKVPSSANQPAAWPGRPPVSSPPASRVVTSGQRLGSKANSLSKTVPLSHRKNGLSTANGVQSNLRLILPAPAKPNGVTDSREVLAKATKTNSRPSDSPSSPAKRPHLDSGPGKEAAVS